MKEHDIRPLRQRSICIGRDGDDPSPRLAFMSIIRKISVALRADELDRISIGTEKV